MSASLFNGKGDQAEQRSYRSEGLSNMNPQKCLYWAADAAVSVCATRPLSLKKEKGASSDDKTHKSFILQSCTLA